MSRDYAKLYVSLADDDDFLSLNSHSQWLYTWLCLSRDLSYCGVLPYLPKRFVPLASDMTERKTVAAFRELSDKRFVVIDRSTDEVLVRSYVRRDGFLRIPNVVRAMNKAFDRVHSEEIREVVYEELARALDETFPEAIPEPTAKALREGFAEPLVEGLA